MLLFIYGTLKRGECNHSLLASQEFVADVRTLPRYRLFEKGWHPCLVEAADGVAVEGELWRVSPETLAALDEYEEVPHGFARRPVAVDGVDEPVDAYFYAQNVAGLRDCGSRWPRQV
jgi:gamma-glutamylaminecyclotransferase